MDTPKTEYSMEQPLYMAMELSQAKWKLGFSTGIGEKIWIRNVSGKDTKALLREIERAREQLDAHGPVRSCYEAGVDGFWIHRFLTEQGIENLVVDSSAIEVSRRRRSVKTDKVDVKKLVTMLMRHHVGEKGVWKVVRVPSAEAEARRLLHRRRKRFSKDITRVKNRIWGILCTQGVTLEIKGDFMEAVKAVRMYNDEPLPEDVIADIADEYELYQYLSQKIKALEKEMSKAIETEDSPEMNMVRNLMKIRGIGEKSAWLLVMEFFSWRDFNNRREVGALAGLAPTPYQSGSSYREQGVSKAGNRWVRHLMVELSWAWLRFQPDCEFILWYKRKYGSGGPRAHKIGIVAVARKLLIALWRYLETGEIPAGAVMKEVT